MITLYSEISNFLTPFDSPAGSVVYSLGTSVSVSDLAYVYSFLAGSSDLLSVDSSFFYSGFDSVDSSDFPSLEDSEDSLPLDSPFFDDFSEDSEDSDD